VVKKIIRALKKLPESFLDKLRAILLCSFRRFLSALNFKIHGCFPAVRAQLWGYEGSEFVIVARIVDLSDFHFLQT
jgi:hypothetical protein